MLFAWLLTRIDTSAAGRAYAAYGGVYIGASLSCCGSLKVFDQTAGISSEQLFAFWVPRSSYSGHARPRSAPAFDCRSNTTWSRYSAGSANAAPR
jgi:hypothetical protein